MSNHLKSAGNHLKKSSSNLRTLFFLPIIIFVIITVLLMNFYFHHPNFDNNTESFANDLKGTLSFITFVSFIGFIIHIITYFSLTGNLNKSGDFLVQYSETIEVNSSDKSTITPKQQKTKNLKGEISKIKDSSGNFFLVVEDRRYYYDSESSVDKSIEHYNETGDLLEDGLLSSR